MIIITTGQGQAVTHDDIQEIKCMFNAMLNHYIESKKGFNFAVNPVLKGDFEEEVHRSMGIVLKLGHLLGFTAPMVIEAIRKTEELRGV